MKTLPYKLTQVNYCLLLASLLAPALSLGVFEARADDDSSRITDKVIPLETDSIPKRPAPLLEIGPPFLETGSIDQGFELPGGAVWQPSLIVWGVNRSAIQTFDDSERHLLEWANRFDLFANLYLTATERVLLGVRPLDRRGRFTRYTFADSLDDSLSEEGDFEDEINFDIETLFFEGDFGELFPVLDPLDRKGLDIYLAVGRQPINLQDGMLVNDSLDALGLGKINLKPSWAVNHRATLIWAWDEVSRSNLPTDDRSAMLFAFSNEIDWRVSTFEADLIFIDAEQETGDGFYAGLGATQRLGHFNTSFRILGSLGLDSATEHADDGIVFFSELSFTPEGSHDFVYLNGFWGLNSFRSASRGPSAGGPLGAVGVHFASVGLGRYAAALDSQPDDVFGGALGYQKFFNQERTQVLLELAGRYATEEIGQRALAFGPSFQQAIGRRSVLRLDLYGAFGSERNSPSAFETEKWRYGTRLEWLFRL